VNLINKNIITTIYSAVLIGKSIS